MHLPQDAIFLRAFIGEADRADGHIERLSRRPGLLA
jgi:hypothetical protein